MRRAILFPDTRDIEGMEGCRLRPGRAVRTESPVLAPTLPCEGSACYVYGSVFKYKGWYRIWHQAIVPNFGDAVCHSLSRDGYTWTRPLFNSGKGLKAGHAPTVSTLTFPEELASWPALYAGRNNIAACLHNPVVIPPDCGDPYPGLYKIMGFTSQGYAAGFSKDGRRFRYVPENPVIPLTWYPNLNTGKQWANDVGIPFWDSGQRRYVGLIKTYEIDGEGRTRRCIGCTESPDMLGWYPVETAWIPGPAEDAIAAAKGFKWADFYGLPAFPYGNGYLGFLWLFLIDRELPKGTHVGKIEVYLAWSRDARRWERISDEPLLANPPDGEWGCAVIHTASMPVRERDHEKVYFAGGDSLHGGWEVGLPPLGRHPMSIGAATLPKNGFCRLWAEDGGFSVPLREGENLVSLMFSSDAGFARVTQEGVEGSLFEGAAEEGQTVQFHAAREGKRLLRVTLRACGVYSITLRTHKRQAS
ncbi:MAG: hypothetical protein LBC93_04320 [Synergistaceae bacterium]|nr:hypothetical protein [Synergistaceae bacterium]